MSKVNNEQMRVCIENALKERKQRKFKETLELQIMLREYDPEKEKRFNSSTVLSHPIKYKIKMVVVGTLKHIEEAQALGIDALSIDDLKKFNNEEKLIKKWARKYQMILVSDSLSKNLTRMIGRQVASVGKLPVTIGDNEKVKDKQEELIKTIRFKVKKFPWLAQAIGTDSLAPEEIRQNLNKSLSFLVSLLPKGWQNIKSLHVKTTMGKPQKLF